jgi:hypothetical protein
MHRPRHTLSWNCLILALMRVFSSAPALAMAALLLACGSGGVDLSSGSGSSATSNGSSTGGSGGTGGAVTTGTGGATGGGGQGGGGAPPVADADGDGLDDAVEAQIAESYLPYLGVTEDDGCPLGGIVYRVRPHPTNAALILIVYDHLFQKDCGLTGHVGDNEAFGITVDPKKPPPAGILSMRAIGHQNTLCEKVTECGVCPGEAACDTAQYKGAAWPVVYSSKDKHAGYVQMDQCSLFTSCFDSCSLPATPATPPMVNAGEPNAHLTEDLTDDGFITAANGWTEMSLFHYNPWDPTTDFGSAGNVADDLVDPAFEPPACP